MSQLSCPLASGAPFRRLSTRENEVERHQSTGVFTAIDLNRYQRKAMRETIQLLFEGKALLVFPKGCEHRSKLYAEENL